MNLACTKTVSRARAVPILLAVLASLVLTACGGASQSVQGSGDSAPPVATPPPGSTGGPPPPSPPPPSPLPPPPPPPIGSSITSATITNETGGTAAELPVTFGQVFKPGDIPSGATLVARLASTGEGVDLQVDKKATHPDGSLRHAVITARLRNVAAGATDTLELVSANTTTAGSAIDLAQLLSTSFDAVVSLNVGGTVYKASARQLLQNGPVKTWLAGPLVTEWMVSAPFATSGGTPHPHLTARFYIRAYAGLNPVRVDVVVENDWAYVANPSNFTYDATVTVGGAQVYNVTGFTHYHHARWRKVFWWGTEPKATVGYDAAYLLASGAVPNYDLSINVPAAAISKTASSWTGSITEPMGKGLLNAYMPTTGSRAEIGPLPKWVAQYLISMNPSLKPAVVGTGDVAGSWPVHYRDQPTDLPLSLDDHPNATILASGHSFEDFPACNNCSTPFSPDSSHQPSLAYVPYLLTGDYYYLEELQFWADWNMFQANPDYRDHASGLLNWDQMRGQAWSLRTLAQAAYITPDTHPMKQYFVDRLNNNVAWYVSNYANPATPVLGFLPTGSAVRTEGSEKVLSAWEDDFFTHVAGYLVDLGYTGAIPLRNWKSKFVVGRFTNDPTFCKYQGAAYKYIIVDPATGLFISDWATLKALNYPGPCPTDYTDYRDSPNGYLAHARVALATAATAGFTGALAALDDIKRSQEAAGADYASDPTWSIAPR